jgi:hypothetical protein
VDVDKNGKYARDQLWAAKKNAQSDEKVGLF